jgi:hypothetical protein
MPILRYVTDIELKRPAPQEKLASEPVRPHGENAGGTRGQSSLEAVHEMMPGMMRVLRCGALGLAVAGLPLVAAQAQESTNKVDTKTDWSVFTEEQPKECWGVSAPKVPSVNTRDGQPVSVRRGDIQLFVTFRPGTGAAGEPSFTGGYPFAPGSTVNMTIGDNSFELIVDGEWAWPATREADASILSAMKNGTTAVLTARSARGTQTVDTFSLLGFTAAMEAAEQRCR